MISVNLDTNFITSIVGREMIQSETFSNLEKSSVASLTIEDKDATTDRETLIYDEYSDNDSETIIGHHLER